MATPEISPLHDLNLIIANANTEQRYRVMATITPQGEALTHAEAVLFALQRARDHNGRDAILQDRLSFRFPSARLRSCDTTPELIGWAGLTASIDTEDMPFERTLRARTDEEGRNSVLAADLYAFIQEVASVTGHTDHTLALAPNRHPLLSLVRTPIHRSPIHISQPSPDQILTCYDGETVINIAERTVTQDGVPKKLLLRDFDLLCLLLQTPERVYTHNFLLECIWGPASGNSPKTVTASINRIRRELGSGIITTTKGVGYAAAKTNGVKSELKAKLG